MGSKFIDFLRVFIFLGLISYSSSALSASWLVPSGETKTYNSVSFYKSSDFFDRNGDSKSQDTYKKAEITSLIEYGFSDKLTLGANIGFGGQYQNNDRNFSLIDPEIYARYLLWKDDYNVFSVQPFLKIPISDENDVLPFSTGEFDAEIRALFGHSYSWLEKNHFINLEVAYRNRGGDFSNEVRFDATVGFTVPYDMQIFLQSFSTISLDSDSSGFSNSTPSDYKVTKLQVSAVKDFGMGYSVQAGLYQDVWGENIGKGTGILFSIWKSF